MSYSGDPSSSLLDEIRFLVADTSDDPGTELLSDDEVGYVITKLAATYDDALMYAAYCADRIADSYAAEVTINADGVSIAAEQLQDKYRAMALALRASYTALHAVGAAPFAGGSLLGQHVWGGRPKNFGIAAHDNPRAGYQDEGYHRDDDFRDGHWQ